jgi:hypothetical protein
LVLDLSFFRGERGGIVDKMVLCFFDDKGQAIMERKLTAIPLKEEAIIRRSIEFFNDPEPCMIHRSAVMKRIYMEFYEFFSQNLQEGKHKLLWNEIPGVLREMMDVKREVDVITVKRKK